MVIRKSLSKILPLNTWALNEYVNIILAKIIILAPDLSEEILNQVQKLNDNYLVLESLIEIIKSIPKLEPQIIKIFQKLLRNYNEDFDFVTGLNLTRIV
ncbi:MAG TPA: hypothetical protein LFW14_05510 [Rickettsia endosymbiont of Degeeriella rufa]|nr:hypothetical protein [Rickettsia endosymbiont of Columbicola hoogstraali]HJD62993.1 hypothetical protein [Rickettsia endosymbiont of Degeeriella rufa]